MDYISFGLLLLMGLLYKRQEDGVNRKILMMNDYILDVRKGIEKNFETIGKNFEFLTKKLSSDKLSLEKEISETRNAVKSVETQLQRLRKVVKKNENEKR